MEFWGVEVKAGESLKAEPGDDKVLHLSQASLGDVKDKNESILLFVKINGQKLVLGTLSPEKCPQISYDLVFEKEFELSHNWKNGSVYFCGYKSVLSDESDDYDFPESDSEEDLPLDAVENGKPEVKVEQDKPAKGKGNAAKPDASAAKPKVKIVEPNKDDKSKAEDEDDGSDDEDTDSDEDESGDDEDMLNAIETDDDDESSDEEDEETPKKADLGKKRAAESAIKTPASGKKAKLVTPQKMDGKKGSVHTATPHPAKQAGKTPASDKSKPKSPTSGGQVSCKSCSKTFGSEGALQSHTKAKHSK